MQLTDHMRKHLLEGVIAAQKKNNPLLEGLDLQRLQHTLERDITEEELASIMMVVGSNREESMRAMCLTMVDRSTPREVIPRDAVARNQGEDDVAATQGWKVEAHARWGHLKRLTHRTPRVPASG